MAERVQCGTHGETDAAFICGHLQTSGPPLGMFWSEGGDDQCGWCAQCEEARAAEGEWNERSEAALGKSRLVCTRCFDALRDYNYRPLR